MPLRNGNFEEDWSTEESHACLVNGQKQIVDNIFTPPGWITWFNHEPGTWDQPEVRDAWKQHDPNRVHSGEKGILLFTFFRKHDAGFLQQVEVVPESPLCVKAWAHAWSNHLEEAHPNNPKWSDGSLVGYDIVALEEDEIPALNGDAQNDANGNFRFCVGIDPTGGLNPDADTVVWGKSYYIYNGYCQELSVEATAKNDIVTIFLRSTTLWAFKHNDAYWDDVSLVANIPAPDRGEPRVQYERTYVLLPPNADLKWANAIIDATWNQHRYTLGGSADDAGVGDLDVRKVIAVNPSQWPGDLGAFYKDHYPGIELTCIDAATPDVLRRLLNPSSSLLLHQCNPLWANIRLAGEGCNYTLCEQGCFVADCAMAQRYYGIDPNATPATVNETLGPEGFNGCNVKWSAMASKLGLQVVKKTTNLTEVDAHLASGDICFAEVEPLSLHHFVMVTRKVGDRYWMLDPWKNFEGWLDEKYSGVDSWRLIRPYVAPPPFPMPPPVTYTPRGVHDLAGADWFIQEGLKGWVTEAVYLSDCKPRVLNLLPYLEAGLRIIVRLSYSYAVDDGGQGTFPDNNDTLRALEEAAVQTMVLNEPPDQYKDQLYFIWGNEMNNPREGSITPGAYALSYNRVRDAKPAWAQFALGAIDPTNAGWGDWRPVWKTMLETLEVDFIVVHAYTHGPDPALIWHDQEFSGPPLVGVYYDMRMLESQLEVIPSKHRDKEVIVTETNHLFTNDGRQAWEEHSGEWVRQAYEYFAQLGVPGCLFRFNYNKWRISDCPEVLEALRNVT